MATLSAMKFSAVVALLGLSLSACTIEQTSQPSPAPQGADEQAAPPTDDDPTTPDTPGTGTGGVSVPGSIVGDWSWVTSSGVLALSFEIGGAYSNDVYLNGHPGESCGIEYFTHRKGNATFTENTLTLRSIEATRTKKDSCKDTTLSVETIEPQDDAYSWRIDADDRGEDLLFLEREGETTKYYRADAPP